MSQLAHVPPGYHSVTPSLTVKDAVAALRFYEEAFGAEELYRLPDETTGKLLHAEFRIGDSVIMMSDEFPEIGALAPDIGKGTIFRIYVEDADAAFAKALNAGAVVLTPLEDTFWGDRVGRVSDPYGYRWTLAHRLENAEGA